MVRLLSNLKGITGCVALLVSQKMKIGKATTPPMTIMAGMAGLCQVVVA
jgi:hypothetical protein